MRPSHPAQPSTKAFYYYIKISMDITRINLFLRSSDVQGRVINTLCFDSPQRNVETLKPFRWLPIPIYQLLTMLSLVHLPPELILEIIQGYLNISDSFHLIQACKHLYKHVQSKAFWLYIVKCVQSWRPIPNSTSWSILPVEPLRDLAIDAIKLTTLFESPTLRGLREVYSLPVKRSAVSDGIMDQGDSLMYSWLTRDGIHSVSVSIRGKLTLWHLPSRYLLVSVDIGGPMQCWDEEVDTEGITIIVNAQTRAPGGASSTFYAYRYDFMTKECNLVVTQTIHGGLECNYIQGNLMGCICQDNGAITIYIIESTSQRRAKIKVLAPRVSAEYFSSFMSVTHGGCYVNMGSTGYYYPFSLEDLKARLAFPMSESTLQLPLIGKYYFDHSEELEESDWGPRCGYTWDGRLGVFSRAVFGPLWSTLILLEHKEIELADGTSYIDEESKVPIKVLEGSLITQHSVHRFVKSKGGWDLYAVGIRAKASVWLEYLSEEGDSPCIKLCFAEFPPVDEVRKRKLEKSASGLAVVPRSEGSPSRGHVCEYVLPEGWMDRFEGGLWSMEYDDTRGQLMFTAGGGEVTIYEVY